MGAPESPILHTDSSLEWHYGHLDPAELEAASIPDRSKARVVQLQIAAMMLVQGIDPAERLLWIQTYGRVIGASTAENANI